MTKKINDYYKSYEWKPVDEVSKSIQTIEACKIMLASHYQEKINLSGEELDFVIARQKDEKRAFIESQKESNEFNMDNSKKIEKSQAYLDSIVDYSHNPYFQKVMNKSIEVEQPVREENKIFGLQGMIDLLQINKTLAKAVDISSSSQSVFDDIEKSFNPQIKSNAQMLLDSMYRKGDEIVTVELPRDFFNNTKFFEAIPTFNLGQPREHTTGEYIAFYKEKDNSEKDFIVNENIHKGIDEVYSCMLRTHKEEVSNARIEDLPLINSKHAFEVALCEFCEKSTLGTGGTIQEQKDELKAVHNKYIEFIEKSTGFQRKPAQDLRMGSIETRPILKEKSNTESLIELMRERKDEVSKNVVSDKIQKMRSKSM